MQHSLMFAPGLRLATCQLSDGLVRALTQAG